MVCTFPNLLSLCRILIIPILVYLLTFPDRYSSLLAAALFLVASVTDYFDGYLARRNKSVSELGKILDPLADKLMVASALIMLAAIDRPNEPSVPAWLVVVVLARETAVTVLRGIREALPNAEVTYARGVDLVEGRSDPMASPLIESSHVIRYSSATCGVLPAGHTSSTVIGSSVPRTACVAKAPFRILLEALPENFSQRLWRRRG